MQTSEELYLSKVRLDWSATRNPYEWHRALWQLFPERPEAQRDFLFRIERQQAGEGAVLLLQSREAPSRKGAAVELLAAPKAIDLSQLQAGMPLRFRLTANVVKTIADAQQPERRIRVPLLKEVEQHVWLKRKLAAAAELQEMSVQGSEPLFFKRKGQTGKLVRVTFDGVLRITDSERFANVLINGIGPAKAFGCGLLSLAPC